MVHNNYGAYWGWQTVCLCVCVTTVMTSPLWTRQLCTSWVAWLVSAGPPSQVGALSAQTVTNWDVTRSPPAPHTPLTANLIVATTQEQAATPRPPNASGQWTPSCCSPRSIVWSTPRCILARTTGKLSTSRAWCLSFSWQEEGEDASMRGTLFPIGMISLHVHV